MATVTEWAQRPGMSGPSDNLQMAVSSREAVADTFELPLGFFTGAHCFIGIRLYDVNGDEVEAATGGSFALKLKTWNTGRWEDMPAGNGSVSATARETVSFRAYGEALQVTPSSVTGNGVVAYEVRVSSFKN